MKRVSRLAGLFLPLMLLAACAASQAGPALAGPLERHDPAVDGQPAGGCVQDEADPIYRIELPAHAPSLGAGKDALVTLVEFSEFQCPYCGRLHQSLKALLDRYPGELRVVFRHQPLAFHKGALPAARAAQAAHRQGRFREMAELLFEARAELGDPELPFALASRLGLDMKRFEADLGSPEVETAIQADVAEAERFGVRGVPTSFVNGRKLSGAQPLETLAAKVEEELARARRAGGRGDALYRRLTACGLTGKPPEAPRPSPPPRKALPGDQEKVRVELGNSYWIGGPEARVEIVVFSDLACPFCGRLAATLRELLDHFGPKVRIHFKHLPLPMHPRALPAAEALMAAGAQGKFWAMHDRLFESTRNLEAEDLERHAQELGLDLSRFRAELEAGTYRAEIEVDLAQAKALQVHGTPTTFVNGWRVNGAQPLPKFQELVERELAAP
jgi:protein-disulfide isomerase